MVRVAGRAERSDASYLGQLGQTQHAKKSKALDALATVRPIVVAELFSEIINREDRNQVDEEVGAHVVDHDHPLIVHPLELILTDLKKHLLS